MAENKTFNTRIKLKYDTYENWTTNNPVLLAGEVAVTTLLASSTDSATTKPTTMIKVGDGTSTFNQLGWLSALGADVYGWAKTANRPQYKITKDASNAHKLQLQVSTDGGTTWENEGTAISTADTTYTLVTGDSNGTVKFNGTNVPVKGLGSAAYTNTNAYATATQGEAADAAMPKAGGTFTGNVTMGSEKTLTVNTPTQNNHAATKAYVDTIIDALDVTDTAVEGKYVSAVSETNGKIVVKRTALPIYDEDGAAETVRTALLGGATTYTNLGLVEDKLESLGKYVEFKGIVEAKPTATTGYKAGDLVYDKISKKEYIVVSDSENTLSWEELGDQNFGATLEALDVTDTAVSGKYVSAVNQVNGKISVTRATIPTHTHKTLTFTNGTTTKTYDTTAEKTVTIEDVAATEGAYNASSNKIVTKSAMDSAISTAITAGLGTLDVPDSDSGFVTKVTQTNGKITVTKATPKIEELAQSAYVIFDCGSSTVNI